MVVVLHRVLPLQVAEVTPKLAYLKAHRGDFDTVFIGSSRFYHGLSPKAFDAAMAAAGKPRRSFNLAVDGMMPPESLHMTRTLLAMRPPRLHTVFLEVASEQPMPDMNNLTVRDIYAQDGKSLIHGWNQALLDFQTTPPGFRSQQVWDDVRWTTTVFVRNELNIGRLVPEGVTAEEPQKFGRLMLGPAEDGYIPAMNGMTEKSRRKLAQQELLIREGLVKERPINDLNEEEYAGTRDLLKEHGIELILVTAPQILRDYHARVDAPPGMRILAFDDPDRHPELFDPGYRSDSDHLNDSGARIFSKELAESYLSER